MREFGVSLCEPLCFELGSVEYKVICCAFYVDSTCFFSRKSVLVVGDRVQSLYLSRGISCALPNLARVKRVFKCTLKNKSNSHYN